MATYYSSPTGSGTGCTLGAPCTLRTGLAKLVAGDTLLLRAGSYVGGSGFGGGAFGQLTASGTNFTTGAITIKNFPGEVATLTAPSGDHVVAFDHPNTYIILDGLVVDAAAGSFNGIKIRNGANHIRIINTEVKNSHDSGILVVDDAPSGSNEFINVNVHHNGTLARFDHGIYIACPNNLVENSSFSFNAAFGIQMDQGNASNNIIRYNRSFSNDTAGGGFGDGGGLVIQAGSNNQVYYNLFYGNGLGIYVAYIPTDTQIYNNVNDDTSYFYNTTRTLLKNNIFTGQLRLEATTQMTVANNLTAATILQVSNSGTTFSNNLIGAAQFVNAATHNYYLQAGSPANNTGAVLGLTRDFAGQPMVGTPNMGAFEPLTTWYARTDGGTTTQCTGRANAAYTGGTGQACSYASLSDALSAAASANVEATVVARAGDTWNQITVPARAASTDYITVQSSNLSSIAAQLQGVTNADVSNMATIATTVDNFAVSIPSGRAYWQFDGFQITTANRSQYYTILIDHAGDHVNFDSCWIHSLEDYTDNPEASCRIGMSYRGTNSAFTNCRMAYFSAYALGTQIVDNNFAIAYAGSTLSVSNSFLGAWFEALISGGSSFAPAVDGVTLSGSPTLTSATLSSVSGLAINDLIALRNYAPRTLTNACSFVAATRTLTCTGGNFTAAYVDIGGGGSPRFQFTSLGIGGTVASVTNSTTAIMTSDLGGSNFSGQTVSIEGVYGAAKVSNIAGNVVTYAPYGITALQAAPEVPGNAQWGGFVPNNLTFTQCMFYNNPVIAGTVRAQVGASPKAFWEIKGIDTFTVTGCEFTGTGTNLGYLVANQGTPSGCPSVWTTITGVNFSSNYYHTDTNQFQIMGLSLANDYYCTSMGGGDITIANNLFTSGAVLSRLISGTNVAFSHNTVINADGGGAQLIQQEAGDSSDDTLGFNYSDNIAFNNFYGLHCSYDGTLGCFPSNVISTNLFIGTYTTDPWCQHGFSPGNVCVVDQTAVKFLDAATNNYRLASDSPGKGTGTGGTDMGVNWATLVAALGFDPSGGSVAVAVSGQVVISGNVTI